VLFRSLDQSFIDLKTKEWWDYQNSVSTWELDNYLTRY
jgi:glutamine synthetase